MVLPKSSPRSRLSVAMTAETERDLMAHLLRPDRQEDLCMVVYRPSTGSMRMTAVLATVILPMEGETDVHGNVSFTGDFVLRAAEEASKAGGGVAIVHSHPGGHGWQGMSSYDADAEASYGNLVREISGLPLLGMTLAGADGSWSARGWDRGLGADVRASDCENVRVVGDRYKATWNDRLVPPPTIGETQARTVSCWGPRVQADLARLRILVIGAGTLGLDVALRLAATGVKTIGILDFDTLNVINLDRMVGPTLLDVLLKRSKVDVAVRLLRAQATATRFRSEENTSE